MKMISSTSTTSTSGTMFISESVPTETERRREDSAARQCCRYRAENAISLQILYLYDAHSSRFRSVRLRNSSEKSSMRAPISRIRLPK